MVKATENVLAIEIDGPQNDCHYFAPLGRRIRGRFDVRRVAGDVGPLASKWPDPLPGQRIGVDSESGEGFVDEPLHDHPALKAKCERLGTLAPARESFPAVHVPTWLYWITSAVQAGIARVVEGKLPEKIDGEPRKEFVTRKKADPLERLTVAIEKQTELLTKLLSK